MGLSPFSTILWFWSVPSITCDYEIKNNHIGTPASITSRMRGATLYPTSGYPAGNSAFILIHKILPLRVRRMCEVHILPTPCGWFSSAPARHATLPNQFPFWI